MRGPPDVAARTVALAIALVSLLGSVSDAAGPQLVRHGPRGLRTVALTIDDGWDAARCEAMYRTLLGTGVPATWFPNAIYVRRHPALWRRIAEDFPIGNHTYSHADLTRLASGQVPATSWSATSGSSRPSPGSRWRCSCGRPSAPSGPRRPAGRPGARLPHDRAVGYDGWGQLAAHHGAWRHPGREPSSVRLHRAHALWPRRHARHPARIIRHYACAGYRFVTVAGLLAREPGVRARVDCTRTGTTGRSRPSGDGGDEDPAAGPSANPGGPDERTVVTELASLTDACWRMPPACSSRDPMSDRSDR